MVKPNQPKIVVPDKDEVNKYAPANSAAASGDIPAGAATSQGSSPVQGTEGGAESPEALKRQIAEYQDKLLRAQAEIANTARRLNQQHAESLRLAGMGLARDLLGVMDALERMLGSIDEKQANDPLPKGARLVADQFRKILKDHGIAPIETVGQPFDPSKHQALLQDQQTDAPAGSVTAELERGYMMHDRVLRVAKVAVAAERESSETNPVSAPSEADSGTQSPNAG